MRLHLVDGTYELFRAHFSKRPGHTAPDGSDAKATVGVAASLLALLHDTARSGDPHRGRLRQPHPLVSQRSLRLVTRPTKASPTSCSRSSIPRRSGSRASGSRSGRCSEYEADDALATGRAPFRRPGRTSADPHAGQRSGPMHYRTTRGPSRPARRRSNRRRPPSALCAASAPRACPISLALTGDTRRWHPRPRRFRRQDRGTAPRRVRASRANSRSRSRGTVKPRGAVQLATTLAAETASALFYRELATLVRNAPLSASRSTIFAFEESRGAEFEAWCERLGRPLSKCGAAVGATPRAGRIRTPSLTEDTKVRSCT